MKRTEQLIEPSQTIKAYIEQHFRDAHPDAFDQDISELIALRRSAVQGKNGPDIHVKTLDALMLYQAQLSFLLTKFPSNIALGITYHLPFPPPFSFQTDPTISLPSLEFERASVLYNIAAVYAGLAANENRSENEGIKRALTYLQSASGTLHYLQKIVLPNLDNDLQSSFDTPLTNAGYDMTSSFIETLQLFCLAEAQECFWQRAIMEKYTNSVIAKLAMKVGGFYEDCLKAASGGFSPAAHYFPQEWIAHITAKKYFFEAVAQYRMSLEDLAKQRYGDEIARMKVADGLLKQATNEIRRPALLSDIKSLQETLSANLQRAIRDNDIIYVSPIPSPSNLPAIVPAGMVKPTCPVQIGDSLEWLASQPSGALFSNLVPYGVHVALDLYEDRKDTFVRMELEAKQEYLDANSATTLQSIGLPGSIIALERPAGLPPSLLKNAEQIFVDGGLKKAQYVLEQVTIASQSNAKLLEEALDILDQEASEEEGMVQHYPELLGRLEPSSIANKYWLDQAQRYRETLRQARKSDSEVKAKWDQWAPLISILAAGEDALLKHIPTSGKSTERDAELPHSARELQLLLEDLEDLRSHRLRLVAEGKRIASKDDIKPQVMDRVAKRSKGGKVEPEWFEDLFQKEMNKYERLGLEMDEQEVKQRRMLEDIKYRNELFINERQDDSRVKFREKKLQEMELAYWKWREIISNCEEGLKFHVGFGNLLVKFRDGVQNWVYGRREEMSTLINETRASIPPPSPEPIPSPTIPPPTFPRMALPPPTSAGWESAEDFLPPPPSVRKPLATPSTRASKVVEEEEEVMASPRRTTRSSKAKEEVVTPKPARKKGGMTV